MSAESFSRVAIEDTNHTADMQQWQMRSTLLEDRSYIPFAIGVKTILGTGAQPLPTRGESQEMSVSVNFSMKHAVLRATPTVIVLQLHYRCGDMYHYSLNIQKQRLTPRFVDDNWDTYDSRCPW